MEGRQLLSAVAEFPDPNADRHPSDVMTLGPDGNLWFGDLAPQHVSAIGRITPSGAITEFPLPATDMGFGVASKLPGALTVGSDGNLWFPEAPGAIGRITPSGAITEFPIPSSRSATSGLTRSPDGNLWFTEGDGAIDRITPAGAITEFMIPTHHRFPGPLTVGPDGNLWFPEATSDSSTNSPAIGRITPAGVITEFSLPPSQNDPGMLTVGSDGNLWFPGPLVNEIGRITPSGVISEFPTPTPGVFPGPLTLAPDGDLWFIDGRTQVGRITPSGAVTEFPLPDITDQLGALTPLTLAPDGALWFAQDSPRTGENPMQLGGAIGRVTLSGVVTESPLTWVGDIGTPAVGGDGNLWFTERGGQTRDLFIPGGGNIARINLDRPLAAAALPVLATAGAPFSGPVAAFSDADPAGTPAGYTATISWGDGSPPSAGTILAGAGGGYVVTGTHTYAAAGSYVATVAITDVDTSHDVGGASATVQGTAIVAGVSPTVLGVQSLAIHRPPRRIIVSFSGPLDPARAQDLNNYALTRLGPLHRPVALASAVYNTSDRTVTLYPLRRLNVLGLFRLTIKATGPGGIAGADGIPLDGGAAGHPGTDSVRLVRGGGLPLRTPHPKPSAVTPTVVMG